MARKRCFEVKKVKFTFYHSKDEKGKVALVTEGLNKYLNKFASDTGYTISHRLETYIDTDVIVDVELTKDISVNTINNILMNMAGVSVHQMIHTVSSKEMRVSVVG